MTTRYNPVARGDGNGLWADVEEDESGDYVLASDYDALFRERDELAAAVERRNASIDINIAREGVLLRELNALREVVNLVDSHLTEKGVRPWWGKRIEPGYPAGELVIIKRAVDTYRIEFPEVKS